MRRRGLVTIGLVSVFLTNCASVSNLLTNGPVDPDGAPYQQAIPRRPDAAMSGSKFIETAGDMSRDQRESLILSELRNGNLPFFLRRLRPVDLRLERNGQIHRARIWVLPDYLSIGSDQDFVRIPMNPITAQRVADHYGLLLPTKKLVDIVYEQADIKLTPQPLKPGRDMVSTRYYERHNELIEDQLGAPAPDGIVAGHKKDLVLTNRLRKRRGRVAIYGWHRHSKDPIQPLSTVHGDDYADYSHGVRLVSSMMVIDGAERPTAEVLKDPELHGLISDEGPIRHPRIDTD